MDIVSLIVAFLLGLFTNIVWERFLKAHFTLSHETKFFHALGDDKNWINNGENYFYKHNPEYSISFKFVEGVTPAKRFNKFPNAENSNIYWVTLKIGNAEILGWNFMNLDGGNFFVPVPLSEFSSEDLGHESIYEYYDLGSWQVNTYKIIGFNSFDMTGKDLLTALKKFAKHLEIIIKE